jgi:hypothetical protein
MNIEEKSVTEETSQLSMDLSNAAAPANTGNTKEIRSLLEQA